MHCGFALIGVQRLWRSYLGVLCFRFDRWKQQRVKKLQRDNVKGCTQFRRNF